MVCPQTQVLRESPEVCEDQMLVDARWGSDSKTQESLIPHPDFQDLFPHQRSSLSKDLLFRELWGDLRKPSIPQVMTIRA